MESNRKREHPAYTSFKEMTPEQRAGCREYMIEDMLRDPILGQMARGFMRILDEVESDLLEHSMSHQSMRQAFDALQSFRLRRTKPQIGL